MIDTLISHEATGEEGFMNADGMSWQYGKYSTPRLHTDRTYCFSDCDVFTYSK